MARLALLVSLVVAFIALTCGQLQGGELHVLNCGGFITLARLQPSNVGGFHLRGNLVFVASPRLAISSSVSKSNDASSVTSSDSSSDDAIGYPYRLSFIARDEEAAENTETVNGDASNENDYPTPEPIETEEADASVTAGESSKVQSDGEDDNTDIDYPTPEPIETEEADAAVTAGESSKVQSDGEDVDNTDVDNNEDEAGTSEAEADRAFPSDEEVRFIGEGEWASTTGDDEEVASNLLDGSLPTVHSLSFVQRAMHPFSLVRRDLESFGQLHARRMGAMNELLRVMEEVTAAERSTEEEEGASVEEAADEEQEVTVYESDGEEQLALVASAFASPFPASPEWTPTNVIGLVLLSLAFVLLVALMILSLASILYGCTDARDDEASVLLVAGDDASTPLLKSYGVEYTPENKPAAGTDGYVPPVARK